VSDADSDNALSAPLTRPGVALKDDAGLLDP
jgi:hypothetical protein